MKNLWIKIEGKPINLFYAREIEYLPFKDTIIITWNVREGLLETTQMEVEFLIKKDFLRTKEKIEMLLFGSIEKRTPHGQE